MAGEGHFLDPVKHEVMRFLHQSQESCWRKGIISAVMGASMGVGLGVFLGTFEGAHGELIGSGMAEQLKNGFRKSAHDSWVRSKYFSRQFAIVGLVYSPLECVIERERAAHDLLNPALAGAVAGVAISIPESAGHGARLMAKSAFRGGASFAVMAVAFEGLFAWLRST